MLGNLNLGVTPLGTDGLSSVELNYASIFISVYQPTYRVGYDISISNQSSVVIESFDPTIKIDIDILPNKSNIDVKAGSPIELDLVYKIFPSRGSINIETKQHRIYYKKTEANIEEYINYIKNNIRSPIWKLELLRKSDETIKKTIEGRITSNSGGVTNTLNEGVRRTCNFTIGNWDGEYTDFLDSISIGDRFKLYLGYQIDNGKILFPQGVFVFDDPTLISNIAERNLTIDATDLKKVSVFSDKYEKITA